MLGDPQETFPRVFEAVDCGNLFGQALLSAFEP
jgi:hypothetical protein